MTNGTNNIHLYSDQQQVMRGAEIRLPALKERGKGRLDLRVLFG